MDDKLPKIDWSKVPCPSRGSRKKRQLGKSSDENNKAGDEQQNRKGDKGSSEIDEGRGSKEKDPAADSPNNDDQSSEKSVKSGGRDKGATTDYTLEGK